jgi:membrane protein implicated in regulation of membrane protease activity
MAMTAEFLFAWWNLIFIVPFLLALLYLGLYAISGATFGDTEADAGVDADGDVGVDADAHVDVDAHVDADTDVAVDADADGDVAADADADADAHADVVHAGGGGPSDLAHPPFYMAALSWLGVGRVPLSLLLMVLLVSWGVIGFLVNAVLYPALQDHSQIPGLSLPAAAAGSLLFTSGFARLMARWAPLSETYARRRHELLGLVGEALYPINDQFGLVSVRDDRGVLFQIPCRIFREGSPIDKGSRVRLVAYNGKQRLFYVTLA